VRNLFRPVPIVLLSLLTVATHAQRILVAGVKRPADCEFATKPLIADLQTVHYPRHWTIIVACNDIVWQRLQLKADARGTNTAFTDIQHRITVLNGLMYLVMPPLRGTVHASSRLVLEHEYGHILCKCHDEFMADVAGESTTGRRPE
jgi:hypothetical protein